MSTVTARESRSSQNISRAPVNTTSLPFSSATAPADGVRP